MKSPLLLIIACVIILSTHSCTEADGTSPIKPTPEKKTAKEFKVKNKKKEKKKTTVILAKKDYPATEDHVEKKAEGKISITNMSAERKASQLNDYASKNGFSTKYCFLVDMSIASGQNRFFVFDFEKNSIALTGLVAHGSCNETFLSRPRFSNEPKCGCSSLGKYKIGEFYRGKYGKSYKLYGLDGTNSNAYERAVVIHAYDCVPDKEIYPMVLCNSQGCPMVSYHFFDKLSRIINKSDKPILLWIYQ